MGLFSLFRKNKQDSASDQGAFRSRSEEQSSVIRSRSSRGSAAANTSGRAAGGRGKAGKDAAADPLLPEKKRARRRLIGAVALTLAVVIVLPMILDSEPKPLNEDIAIQIPSKDQPASALAQPAATDAKQASAAATLDQKEEIVEPASIAPEPATAAPAAAVTQPAPPPVAAVAPPKVVEKPAPKVEEKKPAVAERKEEPKKEAAKPKAAATPTAPAGNDDAARALAILEGKPAATAATAAPAEKKPAATGGRFVIQVAALATQDKVNELRNKLSAAGIHSFTQKIATEGGERTRIRVGPFASREEAERMGGRIKKLGLNATVVPA
ncbi:MAG: SPOR domain-containing protein [Herbaspirillum sp.]|nr:SPOR domain-containing protein [Herbaspirillum sp.]